MSARANAATKEGWGPASTTAADTGLPRIAFAGAPNGPLGTIFATALDAATKRTLVVLRRPDEVGSDQLRGCLLVLNPSGKPTPDHPHNAAEARLLAASEACCVVVGSIAEIPGAGYFTGAEKSKVCLVVFTGERSENATRVACLIFPHLAEDAIVFKPDNDLPGFVKRLAALATTEVVSKN
jgi:hypothetical protein